MSMAVDQNKNILKKQSKNLFLIFVIFVSPPTAVCRTIGRNNSWRKCSLLAFSQCVFSQHLLFQNGVYKTNHRNLPKMVHKTWFRAKRTRNYLHRFSIVFLSRIWSENGEPASQTELYNRNISSSKGRSNKASVKRSRFWIWNHFYGSWAHQSCHRQWPTCFQSLLKVSLMTLLSDVNVGEQKQTFGFR